jgi:hypothetical protein
VPKPLKPTDGRLKASRTFAQFMDRALAPGVLRKLNGHALDVRRAGKGKAGEAYARGDGFKDDTSVLPERPAVDSEHERVMRAIRTGSVEGLTTSDLTVVLVHAVAAAQKIAQRDGHERLSDILQFAFRAADRVCAMVALDDRDE